MRGDGGNPSLRLGKSPLYPHFKLAQPSASLPNPHSTHPAHGHQISYYDIPHNIHRWPIQYGMSWEGGACLNHQPTVRMKQCQTRAEFSRWPCHWQDDFQHMAPPTLVHCRPLACVHQRVDVMWLVPTSAVLCACCSCSWWCRLWWNMGGGQRSTSIWPGPPSVDL